MTGRADKKRLRIVGALGATLLALWLSPAAAGDTLSRIRERQRIVIAHRTASIPFSYLDASGQPIGYAIDICQQIVGAVKRELKLTRLDVDYLAISPATRSAAILEGKADLECGSTTSTAERRRQVAFSIPYFVATARAVVRKSSGLHSWLDLKGHKVVTTKGTTNAKTLLERDGARALHLSLLEVEDHGSGFRMVERGEADAFAMDDILLYGLIASSAQPGEFAVIGEPLSIEPYAVMLSKDDAAFKHLVDAEMARLMNDGELQAIYNKWFTRPIPPAGINLKLPMGPLLREVMRFPSDKFE